MTQTFLVPIDGTPTSEHAALIGIEFAKRANAELLFTNVISETGPYERRSTRRRFAQAILEGWVRNAQDAGVAARLTLASDSGVAETIARIAQFEPCQMVIMGTHGREGLRRALWGSVAERVAELSPVPVMFVRHTERWKTPDFDRLLVTVDTDEVSNTALDVAADLAKTLGSTLKILHVIPELPSRVGDINPMAPESTFAEGDLLKRESEDLVFSAWARVRRHEFSPDRLDVQEVPAGNLGVQKTILQVAKIDGSDLIVMGTNARRGLEKFLLGSVAESVVHHAEVPVLIVRSLEVKQEAEAKVPQAVRVAAEQPAALQSRVKPGA